MPVSLAQMAARSTSATISTPLGDINIVFDPNKVTTALCVQMDASLQERCAALASVIVSWDVYDDAVMTQPTPIDEAHLAQFSIDVLRALTVGIMDAMRPN